MEVWAPLTLFLLNSDIWDRFVEFESFVGDLTSVLKVEKRKAAALKTEVCTHL